MHVMKLMHIAVVLGLSSAGMFIPHVAYPSESADVQMYKGGFESFQKGEYGGATSRLQLLLQQFPDTPLRDVATFWLARSSFNAGDHETAARYMSLFCRDYPDNPLWETAEKELLLLALSQRELDPTSVSPPEPIPLPRKAVPPVSAEKVAAEELHRAELQRSEEQSRAQLLDHPDDRRLAAERKIQKVRDALRNQNAKRQLREKPGAVDPS